MTKHASVAEWIKAYAYAPDDIVLGPHTELDAEGLATLQELLDLASPGWRRLFDRHTDVDYCVWIMTSQHGSQCHWICRTHPNHTKTTYDGRAS